MNTRSTVDRATAVRVGILILALIAVLAIGAMPRVRAATAAKRVVAATAVPSVNVVRPTPARQTTEMLLPGTMLPYAEAAVRARSSGYIGTWSFDIGSRVPAGAVLATVVAPELESQLSQARDQEATATANEAIAQKTATRWQDMLRTHAISQQETDQKVADLKARQTDTAAAHANVARLAQVLAYTKVLAPFAGVVTARNVDVGTLVDPSGSGELFHIAQTDRLRVFISVPDDLAAAVRPGAPTDLIVDGAGTVTGTIARTAATLDPSTRTLRVEVDVPNPSGALLPGAFVQVKLEVAVPDPGYELPIEALLFRPEGPTVAVVGRDQSITLRRVRIRHDYGTRVDVADGPITGQEQIVLNPSDAISAGQRVRVAPTTPTTKGS